jgi:calcineurin-like phosphoesterase family protein
MEIKMNTGFTSDNHFGHSNIIKFCNRPYENADEMDRCMINKWNEVVAPEDTVYLLGDFSFYNDIKKIINILGRLNGIKHFNFGNHDKQIHAIHKNNDLAQTFASYESYREITVEGQAIILCHYAMRAWNHSGRGSWMLFGLTHNKLPPYGKSVDVGVDSTSITGKAEYRPFSFDEIKRFLGSRNIENEFIK